MVKSLFKLPLFLVFIFLAMMWITNQVGLFWFFNIPFRLWITSAMSVMAVGIVFSAAFSFKKAQTTFDPRTPEKSSRLVTNGIFRFSRNPMYLGFLMMLIAGFIYSNNLVNFLFPFAFIFLSNLLYIKPEEHALQIIFGRDYQTYLKQVRRWI